MTVSKRVGRTVGLLLCLQMIGFIVPFVLLLPLTGGVETYLANAGAASFQTKLAVALLVANCALTIGIAITAFRVFREHNESMSLWLIAASIIMLVLQVADNVHVLSMLSFSEQYSASASSDAQVRMLAAALATTRQWAHISELFAIDAWILLFYSVVYRFALVPRTIAVFGLVTVALHFMGIPLREYLGYSPIAVMGMPMAVSHITIGIWLMVGGFRAAAHEQVIR